MTWSLLWQHFNEFKVVTRQPKMAGRCLREKWQSIIYNYRQSSFIRYTGEHYWLVGIDYANSSRSDGFQTAWVMEPIWSQAEWLSGCLPKPLQIRTTSPINHTCLPTPFPIHTQLISLKTPTRQKWLMGWQNTDNAMWLNVAGALWCTAATAVREMAGGGGGRHWYPCWTRPLATSEFINHIL